MNRALSAAERPRNRIGRASLLVAIGLAFGVLCAAAGVLVVGMGHGWGLPLRYGFLTLFLYPLAMLRWRLLDATTPWRHDGALTTAFAVLIAAAAAYVDALPPAPRSETLQWLILGGVPAAYGLVGRAFDRRLLHTAFADAALLAIGILWDVAVWKAFNSDMDGAGLARAYPETVIPWLALWLGWQAVAVLALVRHLRQRSRGARP